MRDYQGMQQGQGESEEVPDGGNLDEGGYTEDYPGTDDKETGLKLAGQQVEKAFKHKSANKNKRLDIYLHVGE